MLKLYNTLKKQKESFKPLKENTVGMYHCGPTVYDYVHIGNLRAYVFADILRRTLEWNDYAVRQVINITDFGHLTSDADSGEDKMLKGLKREGKPITLGALRELAAFYSEAFKTDLEALNIKTPTALPFASDHIPEQIDIIKGLEEKGFTYQTSDGVYFNTEKDPDYGKLGGLSEITQQQTRLTKNTEKKNPRDFVLWKFSDEFGWESPWGKGFPGWHLECSAMSMKYLGDHFDIHTGGKEHIAIHHNNEIAQSESFTGEPFVNYWLHHEWLNLSGAKMAKSESSGITLKTLIEKEFDPLQYRYWLLTAHYRTPADFSWETLEAAQTAFTKLQERVRELGNASEPDAAYIKQFTDHINDDLDTPNALALAWNMLKDQSLEDSVKKATILEFDEVFGLNLKDVHALDLPKEIQELVSEREKVRREEKWEEADKLRKKIEKKGYRIKDTDDGPKVTKK